MTATDELYMGLMSGTSMDGVDAALVSFRPGGFQLHGTSHIDYPRELLGRLRNLAANQGNPDDVGRADRHVGEIFADAANSLLKSSGLSTGHVTAIGSHGQTVRHRPDGAHPFSLQLGDPNVIAERTGITTVADFRRRDMAAGGQGAPLAPAFHLDAFGDPSTPRAIINIGGISNATLLPARAGETLGFDTGPGNGLLDAWVLRHLDRDYDENGHWAGQGNIIHSLLDELLDDSYFDLPAPKSTGKEYFNLDWLDHRLAGREGDNPADVQRTLLELTAVSIVQSIERYAEPHQIFICGGGAHNPLLMRRLSELLQPVRVQSTEAIGLDPSWVEPVAFAWLAMRHMLGKSANLPSVTGARGERILGVRYPGR
jgi:anhydro-N-acetylmuramic acid kinase